MFYKEDLKMEEKCLNKVREIHRVKRVVRFNSLDEAMRFSLMYGDLMKDGKPVINKCEGEDFGFTAGFLMKKEDFENIRKTLNLVYDELVHFYHKSWRKTECWKMENVL
jgi:hypothetical protein